MPSILHAQRAAAALLTAAVASLATLQTGTAEAAPAHSVPTAEARAAGVKPGEATMGWRQQSPTVGRSAPSSPAQRSSDPSSSSTAAATKAFVPTGVLGIDVSSWQGTVNWTAHAKAGKQFAYVKATEGIRYKNPYFARQYKGAHQAGLIRGAYHFATPHSSGGTKQAQVFARSGGGWSADGRTLPGVLDIEYNPYGATCYGKSQAKMVAWIRDFTTEYKRLTRRDAVIYTTTDWWRTCTGNTAAFSTTNPLWLARYGTSVGTLPGRWGWATFWQYTNVPIDQNRFSSTRTRLLALANNTP